MKPNDRKAIELENRTRKHGENILPAHHFSKSNGFSRYCCTRGRKAARSIEMSPSNSTNQSSSGPFKRRTCVVQGSQVPFSNQEGGLNFKDLAASLA